MINRYLGKTVSAIDINNIVFNCSTGDIASGVAITGCVIDRLGLLSTAGVMNNKLRQQDRCLAAEPWLIGHSTGGTTGANQKISVDVKLRHGDSSGGGDAIDYPTTSTGIGVNYLIPATRNYFTSAMTTDMLAWTTGPISVASNPAFYELTGAKRFLTVVGMITKPGNTTVTAGDQMRVEMGIRFGEFTYAAPSVGTTESSTSTA